MRFLLFICLLYSSLSSYGHGQDTIKKTDFYKEIKSYDLSGLWYRDSVTDDANIKYPHSEPLGFIGDSFQRFYIHYISIVRNPHKPYEYVVKGKTMVKNNICEFHGTITVLEADTYHYNDEHDSLQEKIICDIEFYEDKLQPNSGLIKGKMITFSYIDKSGKLIYDAFDMVADGYFNNQCSCTWTSYKTKIKKKCNWGDFRIPESNGFDIGDGEFHPNEKYAKNDWENLLIAWDGTAYNKLLTYDEIVAARQKEKEQWWK